MLRFSRCLVPFSIEKDVAPSILKKFKVSEIDEKNKVIVLRTSASSWSWGEELELTVTPSVQGCNVSIRCSRRVPWNITANLQTPVDTIVMYLKYMCLRKEEDTPRNIMSN